MTEKKECECEACGGGHDFLYLHCRTCMTGALEVKISSDRSVLILDCPVCEIPVARFELAAPKTELLKEN
jgi:hypothetical protein